MKKMVVTVQLFPPLIFAEGGKHRDIELPDGATVGCLLNLLEELKTLGVYGQHGVFAFVDRDIATNDYILRAGQMVKIMLRPAGG